MIAAPTCARVRCAACGGPHLAVTLDDQHALRTLTLEPWADTLRPCAGLAAAARGADWVPAVAPDLDDLTHRATVELWRLCLVYEGHQLADLYVALGGV